MKTLIKTPMVSIPQPQRRLVVLRTEEGLYVGRRGHETILVKEKERAVVWDWEADRVEASIAQVQSEFGKIWTPEPANP